MERRFELRLEAMLQECEVPPQLMEGVTERLKQFVEPFAALLTQPAQRRRAGEYLSGLVSDLERKNVESIAYRLDQDRRNLQHFIGTAEWDHQPLFEELARQAGRELGEDDGVIVFDPSAFPKQGKQSVGVARQWCGRLGKTENCQVATYMAYVSRKDRTLVNTRLYLPEVWAKMGGPLLPLMKDRRIVKSAAGFLAFERSQYPVFATIGAWNWLDQMHACGTWLAQRLTGKFSQSLLEFVFAPWLDLPRYGNVNCVH
jgi:hypothetical protein